MNACVILLRLTLLFCDFSGLLGMKSKSMRPSAREFLDSRRRGVQSGVYNLVPRRFLLAFKQGN